MRTIGTLIVCFAMVSAAVPSLAQDNTGRPDTPRNSVGTSPDGRGSTGWTGGAREQKAPGSTGAGPAKPDDPAADQPYMATGADLKGPAVRFPANKTPE